MLLSRFGSEAAPVPGQIYSRTSIPSISKAPRRIRRVQVHAVLPLREVSAQMGEEKLGGKKVVQTGS